MGKKLAILTGIANYTNLSKLSACDGDIKLVTDVVKNSKKFDEFLVLENSPDSNRVKQEIAAFVRKYQSSDIDEIFFYFTGHGTRTKDDFLFLLSDFDSTRPNQTSLSNSELDSMLRSLSPSLAVKVVDACQSGTEYVKTDSDLEEFFTKTSKASFKDTYFLFSSSSFENSVAYRDFSVFTKSFAKALLQHEGLDIRYRDIMAYIADDTTVTKHQKPLFVSQGSNTEVFCNVSTDVADAVRAALKIAPPSSGTTKKEETESSAPVIAFDDRLIEAVKQKSADYCNEEQAQNSITKFLLAIEHFEWPKVFAALYQIEQFKQNNYQGIPEMQSIAKWLSEQQGDYFAKVTYVTESYEAKEKVEVEDPVWSGLASLSLWGQRKYEYKTVTKKRNLINEIQLTAPAPCCAVQLHLQPKEEALPWFRIFIVYLFSKTKFTVFFRHEREKELSWKERVTLDENEWQQLHSSLRNEQAVEKLGKRVLEQTTSAIIGEIAKDAGVN